MNRVAVAGTDRFLSESINSYLAEVVGVLEEMPVEALQQVILRLDEARSKRQQVFICGNGGSAATAIHFASDLAKGARAVDKPPIKAESLCDNIALLTAWANDVSYDDIFAQRVGPNGRVQWAENGIAVCFERHDQRYPQIASDGGRGAIVTWVDFRAGSYDIYAQRVGAGGADRWTANGVAICSKAQSRQAH